MKCLEKKNINYLIISIVAATLLSCGDNNDNSSLGIVNGQGGSGGSTRTLGEGEWSIPVGNVLDGGPGVDGIPSVDSPRFISVSEAESVMEETDLVVGFRSGDEVKAYPHDILDWHEIVNDCIGDVKFALNYCPLTGTAMAWNRVIDGRTTEFGVSGLLFNTNFMPYDRESNSVWSQMLTASVNGDLRDRSAELLQVIEMPWSEWKLLYPDSEVLSRDTGLQRNYGTYPYGSYRETNRLIFPVETQDDRIFGKERVLGVIVNQKSKVYPFSTLEDSKALTLLEDSFESQDLIVVGNNTFMMAFGRSFQETFDSNILENPTEFKVLNDNLPLAFEDDLGNRYDLFGEVVSGPNQGERLEILETYMGFFFSFPAFFGLPEIFGMN